MEYVALIVSIVVLIYTIKVNRDIARRQRERDIEEFNKMDGYDRARLWEDKI